MSLRLPRAPRAQWIVACGAMCLLATASAHAAVPAVERVLLTVPDCHGVSGSEVARLASLELEPHVHVVTDTSEQPPALSARVQCDEQQVTVEVHDTRRGSQVQVEVDLAAAAPESRLRLLALAVAELVATSRLERAPPDAPTAVTSDVQDEPPRPDAHDDHAERWVWLGPGASQALTPGTFLVGADLGAQQAFGVLAALVELQARFGSVAPSAADVSARMLSASIALGPRVRLGAVQLMLGAGVRVGHIELEATPADGTVGGDSLGGAWLGPLVSAALGVPLYDSFGLRLALEGGYVARDVVGLDTAGRELAALRGTWFATGLALALAIP